MLHEENPETREGERYRKSLERDLQITAPVDNVTAWSDATCTRRFSSLKSSRKTCISISMYTDRCNYPFYLRQLSTSQLFILSKRKCTIPPLLPRSSKEFHLHWVSLSHSNLPSNPPTPPDIYIYIYIDPRNGNEDEEKCSFSSFHRRLIVYRVVYHCINESIHGGH